MEHAWMSPADVAFCEDERSDSAEARMPVSINADGVHWQNARVDDAWNDIVRALFAARSPWTLREIYDAVGLHPKARTRAARSWCAKIRQVLERGESYVRVSAGIWGASHGYTSEEIAQFERARRTRYARWRT